MSLRQGDTNRSEINFYGNRIHWKNQNAQGKQENYSSVVKIF